MPTFTVNKSVNKDSPSIVYMSWAFVVRNWYL